VNWEFRQRARLAGQHAGRPPSMTDSAHSQAIAVARSCVTGASAEVVARHPAIGQPSPI